MEAERFLLKWNNHQSNLVTVFDQLYEQEAFTDVTLACDGRSFAAHKVILSACSPYFQHLFLSNPCKHPIIFMRDVRASDLDALLAFMYRGEINVHQQDLASFLKTAESLQIKGLSDSSDKPRDSSKILEAMERKFSNANSNNPTNLNHMGFNLGNLISSTMNRTSPVRSVLPNLSGLSRALMQHQQATINNNNRTTTPPSKKMKIAEELPRILPKIKSYIPQNLVSPVPGLLTPITLATTVMKSAQAANIPQTSPVISENNLSPTIDSPSPPKVAKKEGFIQGDTPHPVFLVSSVGGLQGVNSSGNSTPSSHEVKIEEEDPLDENNLSDDPGSSEPIDGMDNLGYTEDLLSGFNRDKLTYPCKYCGKRFTQTGTCRRHERLHTAPNSFKCPFCHKGFNRKYRLKEHILSSHPEHTEDPDLSILINNSDSTVA